MFILAGGQALDGTPLNARPSQTALRLIGRLALSLALSGELSVPLVGRIWYTTPGECNFACACVFVCSSSVSPLCPAPMLCPCDPVVLLLCRALHARYLGILGPGAASPGSYHSPTYTWYENITVGVSAGAGRRAGRLDGIRANHALLLLPNLYVLLPGTAVQNSCFNNHIASYKADFIHRFFACGGFLI